MKLGAITPVYNEETLIGGCVRNLAQFVDQHVVLVAEKPLYGEPSPLDKTAEIAEKEGAIVITADWRQEHKQRNVGVELLSDYDYILSFDADMRITRENFEKAYKQLKEIRPSAAIIKQHSYWRDWNNRIIDDYFKPVFALRPDVRFVHIGNVDCPAYILEDCHIHHLAWCFPKDIEKKVKTYSHAPEIAGDWYEKHYKNWSGGSEITLPDKKYHIVDEPIPDELCEFLHG